MNTIGAISPVCFEYSDAGFYVSAYPDAHDSSRMLMPELFLALQLSGDPVAVVISPDQIVVAGSEDVRALEAMAAYAVEAINAAPWPTSWLPLVLRGGEWRRLDAHLRMGSLRDLEVREDIWEDGLQTPALQAYFEHEGSDTYVVPLEFITLEGEAYTWTSWTQDVSALLPRSHGVGLTDADGRILFRSWSDVEIVCGPFIEDRRFHPSRFTPPAWPSTSAWRRLETEFSTPEWWPELAH
jgi:hypothetical protein